MPKFAANLTMLFNEYPYLERFEMAAKAGFTGVELLFPYDWPAPELKSRLNDNNLTPVLFNMPPGDLENGDKGLACIAGRQSEFNSALQTALYYAQTLDCRQVHMMAGIVPTDCPHDLARSTFVDNLRHAARTCQAHNITILVEPINQHDMPGYLISRQEHALELIAQAAEPNIALQMDFYHCQMTQGNLAYHLGKNIKQIGHIQIAGVPDRHEPDQGEINYPYLFELIDQLGYEGWIGCEYRPVAQTENGLGWAAKYLTTNSVSNHTGAKN